MKRGTNAWDQIQGLLSTATNLSYPGYTVLNDAGKAVTGFSNLSEKVRFRLCFGHSDDAGTDQFLESKYLFVDDIEKAPARSEFRVEMLFDLLDTIKRRQLGITVTSNLRLEEFARKLPRGADVRVYRLCREIEL